MLTRMNLPRVGIATLTPASRIAWTKGDTGGGAGCSGAGRLAVCCVPAGTQAASTRIEATAKAARAIGPRWYGALLWQAVITNSLPSRTAGLVVPGAVAFI
jgi:hypothetical protein